MQILAPSFNVTYDAMLSIKSIKLPPLQVDFLRIGSCQVSSFVFVSLMSQVEEETPISDHREGTVLFNKGVWGMLTPPPLRKCNFENLGQMKFK